MTWAYKDCDRPLKVLEKRAEYAKKLKGKVLEEEGRRKEVEAQLETKRTELEGPKPNRLLLGWHALRQKVPSTRRTL